MRFVRLSTLIERGIEHGTIEAADLILSPALHSVTGTPVPAAQRCSQKNRIAALRTATDDHKVPTDLVAARIHGRIGGDRFRDFEDAQIGVWIVEPTDDRVVASLINEHRRSHADVLYGDEMVRINRRSEKRSEGRFILPAAPGKDARRRRRVHGWIAGGKENNASRQRRRRAEFWKSVGAPEKDDVMVGVGIKPVSRSGSVRLIHSAISYAILNKRKSVTLVHKGNIMKFTEGAFRDWGYEIAKSYFGAEEIDGGPWCKIPEGKPGAGIVIKDAIADITLQQVLTRPEDFDVIATLNLNGDYLSDALAAQVGGIGIAPGGNINYITGHAVFEATHGTAPKYANQDKVNPGSVILSGEMMFRYMGWKEVADLILKGLNGAIASKRVTYDFARLMEGATEIKCSAFGDNVIEHM